MSTYQTVADHIAFLTGQDNLSSADLLRVLNFAIDWYSDIAMSSDGKWKFDPHTNTDKPIAATDLVAGQATYILDTSFLQIDRVTILNEGTPILLTARQQANEDPVERTGLPQEYEYDGQSIILYPTPANGVTGGLTINFTRPVSYVTALSETIGIPRIHTEALAVHGAFQVSLRTNDQNRAQLQGQLQLQERSIRDYFSRRDEAIEQTLVGVMDLRY